MELRLGLGAFSANQTANVSGLFYRSWGTHKKTKKFKRRNIRIPTTNEYCK